MFSWDRVKLDWRAYFMNFCHVHGEPVEHAGRLLFRDGYRYSGVDYQGPEELPPEDPKRLRDLMVTYWTIRETKLKEDFVELGGHVRMLEEWQSHRELPLQQVVVYKERGEDGKVRLVKKEPEDLNLTGLKCKLTDLEILLEECKQQLSELKEIENADQNI